VAHRHLLSQQQLEAQQGLAALPRPQGPRQRPQPLQQQLPAPQQQLPAPQQQHSVMLMLQAMLQQLLVLVPA
jgi:hypothetical protein